MVVENQAFIKEDYSVNDWESLKKKGKSFAPTPEALFQPDYIETETKTKPSGYSPARPKIDELEVKYVSLAAKQIFLRQDDNIYAIHLRNTFLVDPKAMVSIARKIGVQKTEKRSIQVCSSFRCISNNTEAGIEICGL